MTARDWILSTLTVVVLTLGGTLWAGHDTRLEALEKFKDEAVGLRERIAVLETKVDDVRDSQRELMIQNQAILEKIATLERTVSVRK